MRKQGGHYGGESGGGYVGAAASQMHLQQQPQQQHSVQSGYYQGRHQEQQDGGQTNNQWRWEADGLQPKLAQTAMSPTAPSSYSEGHGRDVARSYYQDQRLDSRIPLERQGGSDPRSQSHEEDMEIGYEDNRAPRTFDGLEKRILDDVMKLWTEKANAEDVENARHRESLNAINVQYEEQLVALRARQASQREEFLRRESQTRKEQYQKVIMEQYPTSGAIGHGTPRDFNAPPGEPHRAYNSDSYDSYRERGRFPGSTREHGYDSKAPYSRGRGYNSGSRYYN